MLPANLLTDGAGGTKPKSVWSIKRVSAMDIRGSCRRSVVRESVAESSAYGAWGGLVNERQGKTVSVEHAQRRRSQVYEPTGD